MPQKAFQFSNLAREDEDEESEKFLRKQSNVNDEDKWTDNRLSRLHT
ncbi:hypothetical protein RvY_17327 [Ramazzottius varieornatus]|uniref:Uncharacterized protein n=1 Tax=Ramazzottius varieornatus TaxID=947166 RepID=A0A1D1W268_RAMVA|nr:hypothetical protein RvY_17327 [Ramazzottius varieornatus]